MIQFEKVSKIYPPNSVAVQDVSFTISQGEFISLVGKSGAGKSTLLELFLREEFPSEGRVLFQGDDVHLIKDSLVPEFRRKVGAVFQDYKLLPNKTAYENIAYIMEVMGAGEEDIVRDVSEVLEIVGLIERAHHYPAQLSGGENMTWTMAIDIARFRDVNDFKAMMDDMIRELHATPALPGEERVLVAGDPEGEFEDDRSVNGVPVENGQYEEMRARAVELGVEVVI